MVKPTCYLLQRAGHRLTRFLFSAQGPVCTLCALLVLGSCRPDETMFVIRVADETGLDFENTIVTSDTFNALNFEYIYNGAGVGIGDFNNDGLQDVFFGGNQVSSKLYLNAGDLKFEEVTEKAGLTTTRWVTGVSVVDINGDGFSDIYLSVAGKTPGRDRRNLLFVNQGIVDGVPVFEESASAWGLDSEAYSTMAAFFDYDKDGDLDVYLLNNWLETFNRNNLRPRRINGEAESNDQFFRNNGNNSFTDISREAGILTEGYGLGVAICDVNGDSWPDVYVANDFMSNDLLWINQHDGTFENEIGDYLQHQSHNGMGVDIADFNNDALPDILVVDMLPPGHVRQKMMTPGQNYDHFHMSLQLGYQPQYMRNTLQMNRGKMGDGKVRFSEIAFMAGVAATDWSWAPLFADFDNDGFKDIFIANGYRKDVTNLDFIFFGMDHNPFGTPQAREKMWRERFEKVPEVKISNYVFQNDGSLVFKDKTREWGIDIAAFSNGAAYADFDNDGDLDLITNNIDSTPTLYENRVRSAKDGNHYLRLVAADSRSANEKIRVFAQGTQQYIERTPYRGFQSTVEPHAHFGVGNARMVDSVIVEWPDGTYVKLEHIPADTTIEFSKEHARTRTRYVASVRAPVFVSATIENYVHRQGNESDIKSTRTLLHELSRYGPCLATGDVNNDGLDDFLVGGEGDASSRLFLQEPNGAFSGRDFTSGIGSKDGYALFFDADGDGDVDLYLAKASPDTRSAASPHELHMNDGLGNFTPAPDALPLITTSASCVAETDMDGDGDQDLFVGGRIREGTYPFPPESFLLRNDNGRFVDVTVQMNPALKESGMVSSAVWADINNDQKPDLILAGEWQPIKVFRNDGEAFAEITTALGLGKSHGWWNCIKAADLNGDGFVDLVAGNTGKNSFFKSSTDDPVQIVARDFDGNGSVDPIVTYFNPVEQERYMVHNRLVLIDQVPRLKKRFETFTQYATTPFERAFTAKELHGAAVASAYKLESVILLNEGGTAFTMKDLPDIAQVSVINDLWIEDINGDAHRDIIAIGNMYGQETLFGRYNASLGTVLLGDGHLNWKEVSPAASGFVVAKDARYLEFLRTPGGRAWVVTNNRDSIQVFSLREQHLHLAHQN